MSNKLVHSMQNYKSCKLLVIYVNLTDSETKFCLPQAVPEGKNTPRLGHITVGGLSK